LRTGVADYVIVGEGEMPLAGLLDAVREGRDPAGIQGLWYMRDGEVVAGGSAQIPDVDELPRPAYDLRCAEP